MTSGEAFPTAHPTGAAGPRQTLLRARRLLLLGLLAAPAGAAHRITSNPYRGLLLSAVLAVASVWIGLTLSYAFPTLPPSSMIIATAVAA